MAPTDFLGFYIPPFLLSQPWLVASMYSVKTMHSFLFCLTASQSYQIQPLNSESIMQLDVRTAHLQCCREIALPMQSAAALTSGVGEFIPVCTLLLLLLISIHPFFSSSPCTAFFYHLLFSSIPYLPLLLLGSPHSTSSYYILLPLLLFSLACTSSSSSFHPSRFQCTALPTRSHASRLVIRHSYNFFSPH